MIEKKIYGSVTIDFMIRYWFFSVSIAIVLKMTLCAVKIHGRLRGAGGGDVLILELAEVGGPVYMKKERRGNPSEPFQWLC